MSKALKADGFDNAIMGYGTQFNCDVVIYNYYKCIEILMDRDNLTYEQAVEYMEYNVCGAWVGNNTPVFMRDQLQD